MRKDLAQHQAAMKERQAQPAPARVSNIPPRVYNPVKWDTPVVYTERPATFIPSPLILGVYLLSEDGLYYIGQSQDAIARVCSHRVERGSRSNSGFENPSAVMLAELPDGCGSHALLIAERRFIVAALALGLPLANKLSDETREKYRTQFSDLSFETERLEVAVSTLLP